MTAQPHLLTTPVYTEEDHHTWSALYKRQIALVADVACQLFLEGLPRLQLDPNRLPDPNVYSQRLSGMTGWTLGDAQNEYLGATEWFEHLAERRFPVTNYIRRPHELDFTPLPDLFHEYFGHLAFFTDPDFADTAQKFGPLYLAANERQQLEIARLWWFTTEFGLIREDGRLKIFGAGLLSSHGELQHALKPETPKFDFDIRRVAETPSAVYNYHDHYFILDDPQHVRRIIQQYARMEGLPVPA
jgi:phenylalanine-4-hydroxylase